MIRTLLIFAFLTSCGDHVDRAYVPNRNSYGGNFYAPGTEINREVPTPEIEHDDHYTGPDLDQPHYEEHRNDDEDHDEERPDDDDDEKHDRRGARHSTDDRWD